MLSGCGKKAKTPEPEIRLPRMTSMNDNWANGTGTGTEAADANKAPVFGQAGEWQPGSGVPSAGSLSDSSMMTTGMMDDAASRAAKDSATGDFLNSASTDGVEDGTFVSELEMVHFPYDSSEIAPDFTSILDQHASWINEHPSIMVQVEGHCDERGTEEYNVSLGQRRADTVREYLIGKGVDANRLSTISYGKLRPLTFDQTDESHALNRRAMFLVYEVSGDNSSMAAAY
jgi:peptidoglycan-associated lipoprotein